MGYIMRSASLGKFIMCECHRGTDAHLGGAAPHTPELQLPGHTPVLMLPC